jgi:hypothetical protein
MFLSAEAWHLFELFVLFGILRTMSGMGKVIHFGVLFPGRADELAEIQCGGRRVIVRYQRQPDLPAKPLPLNEVLHHYELPGGPGVPDIEIESSDGAVSRLFIEVKYTSSPGYLVDGFYQLARYVEAFEQETVNTAGVLVGDWAAFANPAHAGPLTAASATAIGPRVADLLGLEDVSSSGT